MDSSLPAEVRFAWDQFNQARFVDQSTYESLLVSRRRLQRWNVPSAGYLGLLDLETGEYFLVESEIIDPHFRSR